MTEADAAIPQYAMLLVRQEDRLRWIVFNQPSTLNAFDHPQWKDLVQALTDAEADEGVGCVAITIRAAAEWLTSVFSWSRQVARS
jgi:enoyl-CoA hydratase/carnithine racemase